VARLWKFILGGLIHVGVGVDLKGVSRFGGCWKLSNLFLGERKDLIVVVHEQVLYLSSKSIWPITKNYVDLT
jgi:hypothetical protein